MERLKKIDIHVHTISSRGILRPTSGDTFATPDELCAMYDKLGVEKGVLLPSVSPDAACDTVTVREIEAIVKARPDRFSWFCNVDPRQGLNSPETDFSYFFDYYKARGARGVGEVTANLSFTDPLMRNFFKHVERSGLPMTIHIGVANVDYGIADEFGLPGLERTLLDFPKLRVLGHSQRFWSHLGGDITQAGWGGYPAGRVVPGGRVVELMRRCPNLCGDLSAGSGCNALLRDPAFAWDFIEEFQDRLYYGTDICSPANLGDMRVKLAAFLDESMESGKISYAAYEKVCRGNALKLLEG